MELYTLIIDNMLAGISTTDKSKGKNRDTLNLLTLPLILSVILSLSFFLLSLPLILQHFSYCFILSFSEILKICYFMTIYSNQLVKR